MMGPESHSRFLSQSLEEGLSPDSAQVSFFSLLFLEKSRLSSLTCLVTVVSVYTSLFQSEV